MLVLLLVAQHTNLCVSSLLLLASAGCPPATAPSSPPLLACCPALLLISHYTSWHNNHLQITSLLYRIVEAQHVIEIFPLGEEAPRLTHATPATAGVRLDGSTEGPGLKPDLQCPPTPLPVSAPGPLSNHAGSGRPPLPLSCLHSGPCLCMQTSPVWS